MNKKKHTHNRNSSQIQSENHIKRQNQHLYTLLKTSILNHETQQDEVLAQHLGGGPQLMQCRRILIILALISCS